MPNISCDIPVSPIKQMKRNNQPFIVSIEGNIGAGKSTMLKFFEKYADVELIPEPVAQWCDVNGHNLLGKLYEDPKRWKISNLQFTKLATADIKVSVRWMYLCYHNCIDEEIILGGHSNSKVMSSWHGCSFLTNQQIVPSKSSKEVFKTTDIVSWKTQERRDHLVEQNWRYYLEF